MDNQRNVMIAKENEDIFAKGYYQCLEKDKQDLILDSSERKKAKVYLPEDISEIIKTKRTEIRQCMQSSNDCILDVCNMDSFECVSWQSIDKTAVLNFANAMHPGGGYLCGSRAQEESLCRCSTLYESLTSSEAAPYYEHNRRYSWLTDESVLISPNVVVFRDHEYEFLEEPFITSVITSAALNLLKNDEKTSPAVIDLIMKQKIRAMLLTAFNEGYRYLVLGAWGCGAFAHDAFTVAQYFKEILVGEQYYKLFAGISFAILDHTKAKANLAAFEDTFCGYESFHEMEKLNR